MGGSQSLLFTTDEVAALTSLTGEEAWAHDSAQWHSLLRLKQFPWDADAAVLIAEAAPFAARLGVNDARTHNLATLACTIAQRLPCVFYFSRTDIEMTISGVVLLRVFVRHALNTVGTAALFEALSRPVNPPASASASRASEQLASWSWTSLLSECVAFLAGSPAPGAVHPLTAELHTQVASLLLTLLAQPPAPSSAVAGAPPPAAAAAAKQPGAVAPGGNAALPPPGSPAPSEGGAEVLRGIALADAAFPDGGISALAASGGRVSEPALRALMLLGGRPYVPASQAPKGRGASAAATEAAKSSSSSSATWAAALIAALLRNIAVDGARTDESDTVGPGPSSAAGRASLAVVTQRTVALAAYHAGSPLGGGETPAKAKANAVPWALDAVVNVATSSVTVPAGLVARLLEDSPDPVGKPLAERSALLLLLLAHNLRAQDTAALLPNPYREALSRLTDSGVTKLDYSTPLPTAAALEQGVGVAFRPLYSSLVIFCEQPLGVCLLYTLLQGSRRWADHVLSRTDVDALLMPLLAQLYAVPTLGPDHRYILLITLLLFTQDAAFCETAHRRVRVSGRSLGWFRDRRLGDTSLGSLLLTCLMRTVAVTSGLSTAGASDSYLHTNCFAASANMAPFAEGLHTYAAQRTLATLSALHRKHSRFTARLRALTGEGPTAAPAEAPSSAEAVALVSGLVNHYDQCLRIGCETLLATCAPASLPRNVAFLYALLHERAIVDALAADPAFTEVATPLLDIVTHFAAVVSKAEAARALTLARSGSGGAAEVAAAEALEATSTTSAMGSASATPVARGIVPWEESEVAAALTAATKVWTGGEEATRAATSLAEVKFLYEEDLSPELFFVPYVQGLVAAYTGDLGGPAKSLFLPVAK